MNTINMGFPAQQLPFKKKTKTWRMSVVDWGANKATVTYSPVRKSVIHKKINYDLLNGVLHMQDLKYILNPDQIEAEFMSEEIAHYPIMNSKLNVLRGEESKRTFDYKVVVTNPNAISEIEENKKAQFYTEFQALIQNSTQSDEEFNQELEKLNDYFSYDWQDMREVRANSLLNHYVKEQDFSHIFNRGFMDAMTVGEELYQCDIVGGEPVLERLDPLKVRIFRSGYSNKVEDADMIVIDDYWSPGRIIDTYGEELTEKDMKYIENVPSPDSAATDSMGNLDERKGFIHSHMMADAISVETNSVLDVNSLFTTEELDSLLPYDMAGNIRVCRVYWKSKRKIKKVKSYDPQTGEEVFNFYPETYVCDQSMGEEEKTFWINEAWEGTKIGEDIYVNMRPRLVQYNRLSNPSRCHFGIIGSIYNLSDDKPFSLVDMMKQYNYLYDAIHDRLNKLMTRNWGKIIQLDFAKVPKGWDIEKWMYYARTNGIAVVDSFKEGNYGAATGKLAGALNNASSGAIDADFGNNIQQYINLLEFIKLEMADVAGISKQREGQISNRETVGGVERATLQSSHITEWLFVTHDNLKKRVMECFLETAKIALRGRNKKFQYILSDGSSRIMDIEGDNFAECDYGLVVDNTPYVQDMNSKLDALAQAALQNQTLSFSTIMKLYGSSSFAEKERFIAKDEQAIQERQAQAQQAQQQAEQQAAQMELQAKQEEMQLKDQLNQRDNETKILIATMSAAQNSNDGIQEVDNSDREALAEKIREFDAKLKLDRDKLHQDDRHHREDLASKEKLAKNKARTTK